MRAYRRRRFSIEPIKHDAGRTVERNVHHAILDLHIFDMSANSQPHAGLGKPSVRHAWNRTS